MIRDFLLPILTERFPGRFVTAEPGVQPCVTFPAKHPQVGDVQIYDDGDEITLIAGNFTHGHFSNYDEIPVEEKEKIIADSVADFLDRLFSDQVVLWGSHKGSGGWQVLDGVSSYKPRHNEYVWSGPRRSITSWFGVAGITIAALAVAASACAAMLPYRLSPSQAVMLNVAALLQLAGPVFAAGLGSAALRGDARSRRLGYVALALSAVTFAFLIFTSHVHSTSRR